MCHENLVVFADMINGVHGSSNNCYFEDCPIIKLPYELNRYTYSRRCPRLAKKIFGDLCEKHPQVFNEAFLIATNRKKF